TRSARREDRVVNEACASHPGGDQRHVTRCHTRDRLKIQAFHNLHVVEPDAQLGIQHLAYFVSNFAGACFASLHQFTRVLQAAVKGRRALAFLRAQIAITRTQGQAILVAHDGADGQADVEIQIPHQPAKDDGLLEVLLAEVSRVRRDDIEKLQQYRGDAPKVAWPRNAFVQFRQGSGVNPRLEPFGVNLRLIRNKHGGNREASQELEVTPQIPWVTAEVFAGAELAGVHENGYDDGIALLAGASHQAQMSIVQRTHGRDKPKRAALLAEHSREAAHFVDRGDETHA